MLPTSTGRGQTGIGENFARARLLLAKRAGYLPQNQQFPAQPGAASDMWHSVSKNLNASARQAGYPHPNQFLRQGIIQGGKIPKPIQRGRQGAMPSLVNANSSMLAQGPIRGNPFENVMPQSFIPPPMLPQLPQLPQLPAMRGIRPMLPRGY